MKKQQKQQTYNLEMLLEQTNSKKAYVHNMRKLDNEGANFRVLDKFHYLVNKKLDIECYFYTETTQVVHDGRFCPKCGNYIGHDITEINDYVLLIDDIENVIGTHTARYIPVNGCVCGWENPAEYEEYEED